MHTRKTKTCRRGTVAYEAMAGVILSISVVAGMAQIVTLIAVQQRSSQRQSVAACEVANVMEDLMALPWAKLNVEGVAGIELSTLARKYLPDAALSVNVSSDDAAGVAKRLAVSLDWQTPAGQRVPPIHVTAWRYGSQEATP